MVDRRKFIDFLRNSGFVSAPPPAPTPMPRYENQGMLGRGGVTGGPALNRQYVAPLPRPTIPPPPPQRFTDAQTQDQFLNSTFQNFNEPGEMNQQFLAVNDPEIARQIAENKPLGAGQIFSAIASGVSQVPEVVDDITGAIKSPQDTVAPVAEPVGSAALDFYNWPLEKRKQATGDAIIASAQGDGNPLAWQQLISINPKAFGLPGVPQGGNFSDADKAQIIQIASLAEANGEDPGRAVWEWYIGKFNLMQRAGTEIVGDPANWPFILTPVGETVLASEAAQGGSFGARLIRGGGYLLKAPEVVADAPIEVPKFGWRVARWGAGAKARETEEGVAASIPIIGRALESSGGEVARQAEGAIADQIDSAGRITPEQAAEADQNIAKLQQERIARAQEQAQQDLANEGVVPPTANANGQPPVNPNVGPVPSEQGAAAPTPNGSTVAASPNGNVVQPTGPSPYTQPTEPIISTPGGDLVMGPEGPELRPASQALSPSNRPTQLPTTTRGLFNDVVTEEQLPANVKAAHDSLSSAEIRAIQPTPVSLEDNLIATQETLLPEHLQRYLDDPNAQSAIPELDFDTPVVVKNGNDLYLMGGTHRTVSAAMRGESEVPMRVIDATNSAFDTTTVPGESAVTLSDSPADPWATPVRPDPTLPTTVPAKDFRGQDYALNPNPARVGVLSGAQGKVERAVDRVAHDQPQVMDAIQNGTDLTGMKAWNDSTFLANNNLLRTESRADEAARTIAGAEPQHAPLIDGRPNPDYEDFRGINKALSNTLQGEWYGRFRLAVHANGGDVRSISWTTNPAFLRKVGDIDLAIREGLPVQRTFKDLTKESAMDYFIHGEYDDVKRILPFYEDAKIFRTTPPDMKAAPSIQEAQQRAYDRFVYASQVRDLVQATPEQLDALLERAGMVPVPEVLNDGDLAKLPDFGTLAARGSRDTAEVLDQVMALPVADQNAIYRDVGTWAEDAYARIAVATPRERVMTDLELTARLSEAAAQRGHVITVPEPSLPRVRSVAPRADAGSVAIPQEVQRIEEAGSEVGSPSKPQGLYTTPSDVASPHADLGGQRSTFTTNPDARVLPVQTAQGRNLPGMRRGAFGESGGIAALRSLVGDEELARLGAMRRDELVTELTRRFPDVDWSRYFDEQDVLEAYAGIQARQAGYDAIWAVDPGASEFNEYIALTDGAFTRDGANGIPDPRSVEELSQYIRAAVLTRDDIAADAILSKLDEIEVIRRTAPTANVAAEPALHTAEQVRHDTYVDIRELRQRIYRPGTVDAEDPMRTFANEVEHNARLDQEIADAGGRASEPTRARPSVRTATRNGKRITDEGYQRLLERRTKQILKEWDADPTKGVPTKGDVLIGMMRADGQITDDEATYLRTAIPIYASRKSKPVNVTVFDLFFQQLDKHTGDATAAKRETASIIAKSVRSMPEADVPLVIKALKKPGRIYDKMTNFTREQLLYGLNAYKGGVVDGVTTAYTVYLHGHRASAFKALSPKTWTTMFLHNLKGNEISHPILKMADAWQVKPGRNVIDVATRELQENVGDLLITRLVGDKLSSPWKLGQSFRHAFDQSHRLTLWGDEFGRQLRVALDGRADSVLRGTRGATSFYDRVIGVMGGGPEADAAVRDLKRLLETEGAFTPKQVREITGSSRLMDEWRQSLNTAKKAADDEVDRVLFSYRQTKGDDAVRRIFMFHYWQSRAVVQHTKLAITNPLLLHRYAQMWEALDREAQRQGETGPLAPFKVWFEFMKGDGGLYGLTNPISVLVPMAMFADAFDSKYSGEKRFEFLLRRSGLAINPMVQSAAYVLGQMNRPADITGTTSVRNVVRHVLDWDRNHHNILHLGPGLTGDWFLEKQDWFWDRVNRLAREFEDAIPDTKLPNRDKTQQDVVIDIIMEQAQDDFGVPYIEMTPAQQQEVQDAIWAVRNGESDNARANEAMATASPYWRPMTDIGVPGGVSVRSEAGQERKDQTSAGFDTPANQRTPEQENAMAQTDAVNAGSPEAATLDRENAALDEVGTPVQQILYDGWNTIAFGDLQPGMMEIIGGKKYTSEQIMAMSPDDRKKLADLWVLDQNGAGLLKDYRQKRDEFIGSTTELGDYKDYQKRAREYGGGESRKATGKATVSDAGFVVPGTTPKGGMRDFRAYLESVDPNFAFEIGQERKRLHDQGLSGEELEARLDIWANSPAGYNAFRGSKDRAGDPTPKDTFDPSKQLPPPGPGEQAESGSGSAKSGTKSDDYMPDYQVQLITDYDAYSKAVQEFEATNGPISNFQSPLGQRAVEQFFAERGIEISSDLKKYLAWAAEQQAAGKDDSMKAYIAKLNADYEQKKKDREAARKSIESQ